MFIYKSTAINLIEIVVYPISLIVFAMCIQRYKGRSLLAVLFLALLVFIVGLNSNKLSQLFLTYVLIVGAKGIRFKEIIKLHFILILAFCLFNMMVDELGMTKVIDTSDEREGFWDEIVQRKDFGYGWCTDFAIHVFFILLDYWILRGRLKFVEILAYIAIIVFIIIETDSRMASGCILLIVFSSICISLSKNKPMGRFKGALLICSVPFFAILSIWATIKYDESDLIWVGADLLLTGRLHIGNEAINDVGIPWLGQNYVQYGMLNVGIGDAQYNYLDCSYVQSAVIYGILLTIIWVYTYFYISKMAYRRNDKVLMSAVFISGIAGIIAQFSFVLTYCILLLASVTKHQDNHKLI